GNKSSTSCSATLLSIPCIESFALRCDAINVGSHITHHSFIVTTAIEPTDVITHDDEDIGFAVLLLLRLTFLLRLLCEGGKRCHQNNDGKKFKCMLFHIVCFER